MLDRAASKRMSKPSLPATLNTHLLDAGVMAGNVSGIMDDAWMLQP